LVLYVCICGLFLVKAGTRKPTVSLTRPWNWLLHQRSDNGVRELVSRA